VSRCARGSDSVAQTPVDVHGRMGDCNGRERRMRDEDEGENENEAENENGNGKEGWIWMDADGHVYDMARWTWEGRMKLRRGLVLT